MSKMTQDSWDKLSPLERRDKVDLSALSPQLSGLEGKRIEVVTTYGETRRFWVGKSTGWKPIHLEVKTSRSVGGEGAERTYASVRVLRHSR